ncbi:MAG: signal recognition particle-docking protein FtsY [Actinobacteria bacterium]|nr:signal recognition particle-docking protein FtsY [Actinomycetota bacterium]
MAGAFVVRRSRRGRSDEEVLNLDTPPPANGTGGLRPLPVDDFEMNEPSSGVALAPEPELIPDIETVAEIEDALAQVTIEDELAEIAAPRFRDRLGKARGLLSGYVVSMLSRSKIDPETWVELEEALIRADVGATLTASLIEELRDQVTTLGLTESADLIERLKADIKARLFVDDRSLHLADVGPSVWLFVGVNGVGKTTTIGKLASREHADGRSVLLAAGDTFRAAAVEQLGMWAERAGVDVVRGGEGSDPSAVIFDAIQRAAARGVDLVMADTAGRLHTKVNLMEELKKVRRVAEKPPGNVTEVLLVLDATTGQNGLTQAREFAEAVEVTGVVLTKLDGSAKGGIVLAIQSELGIPVKLVGLGEAAADLVAFDPDEFVEALFS